MSALRNPLLPVGLLLIVLGIGNWWTGRVRGHDYERLLASGRLPDNLAEFEEFDALTGRTNASLLDPIQRGNDESTLANAKLDFYKVVQGGGRILVLAGLFCTITGLFHAGYRQHQKDVEESKDWSIGN